ncbi:MAG: glycosyltransferase family 2 protein [Candidatus Micrarchaeota archaeon]|nr:glycosyltransferase family 2 protein [Candidatus Micrarchaeota archaeon]
MRLFQCSYIDNAVVEIDSMDENQKISIVTPSYNHGKFIERTILSIKNQNYQNYEHIVVDGESTDETNNILKKYPEIVCLTKKSNQSNALNTGFKLAKGDIIGWISSDDIYVPGAFETAIKYLTEHQEVDLVYTDCNFIDENDKVIGNWHTAPFSYFRNLNYAQMIPQPTAFFRKTVFEKAGYIDENLNYGMDYDFFIRVSKKCKIDYIPNKIFANFRVHSSSKTMSHREKFEPEIIKIRTKYGAIIPYFAIKTIQNIVGRIKKRI